MALNDKDIIITPNIGSTSDPKIEFKGANATTGPSTITATIYPTNNGTLSFQGTEGTLFSITNSLSSGSIFSVNPISGIPIIDVNANKNIALNPYGGNTGIGTTNPIEKLHVVGGVRGTSLSAYTNTNGSLLLRDVGDNPANNAIEFHVRPVSGKSGYLTFTEDSIADRWSIGILNGQSRLRFINGTPSSGTEVFTITSSGSIGIGITNPLYKLHVVGGNVYVQNGYIQSYNSVVGSSGDWAVFGSNSGTTPVLINRNADPNGSKDLFINASGKVGLGVTTSLNGLLTLHQNDTQLYLKQSNDDAGFILGCSDNDGYLKFQRRGAGGNTTYMVISPSGNIGIGITIPGALLDVGNIAGSNITAIFGADANASTRTNATNKAARIGISHYTSSEEPVAFLLAQSVSGFNTLSFGGGTALMNAASQIEFYTASNGTTVTGTKALIINNQQNVGIGTESVASRLHISSTGDPTLTIQTLTAGGDNRINFRNSSGTDAGGVWYLHNGNHLTFNTGGSNTERVRITNAGNVGIGTINPLTKLDTRGSLHVGGGSDGIWLGNLGDNSAYDNVKLYYTGYDSGNPRIYLTPRTQPGTGNVNTYLHLQSNNLIGPGANNMGLLVDGNTGIGTINPVQKLSVYSSATLASFNSSSTYGDIVFTNRYAGGTTHYIGCYDASLRFYANSGSVPTMTISGGAPGNVGIGITNPSEKLEVNGRTVITTGIAPYYGLKVKDYTNTTGLYLGSVSGGNAWYIGDSYYYNSLLWRTDKTAASSINFINGSVEFYTNSGLTAGVDFTPSRKAILDVNGNLLINRSSSTGTVSQRLQVDGGAYFNDAVAIGITNPSALLQVVGNENFIGSKITASGNTYGTGSFLNAFTTAGSNDLGFAGFIASQINQTNRLYMGVHSPSGFNQAFVGTPDSNPLTFWTAGTEKVRITSTGNFGIGTNNPLDKLEVAGNFKVILDTTISAAKNVARIVELGYSGITGAKNWALRGAYQYGTGINSNADGGDLDLIKSLDGFTVLATKTDGTTLGRVGIGSANPRSMLDIRSPQINIGEDNNATNNAQSSGLLLQCDTGDAAGSNGAGIKFAQRWFSGSTANIVTGAIYGYKRSGTGNFGGGLKFATSNGFNTNLSERMLIDDSGNVGVGVASPLGRLHVTTSAISASAPSLGWPVYNAEQDTNSRNIYFDTAGNGNVSTASSGATLSLVLGQYYDSRVVITAASSGGASPSDQGTARGKDMLIKAGQSDNGPYLGGRLFLSGGSGYLSGSFNTNYGAVSIQPFGGNTGIGTINPLQRLHVQGNLLVAAGSATGQHITQKPYELNGGTLSWEGSAGQLFSITNNLTTGSIFSVNDISGIPSIDVNANGTIQLGAYGGNVGVGVTNPAEKLHVVGNIRLFAGGYPYIDMGVNTSNYFRIIHDNPNDRLFVGKNGNATLVITGGNNVEPGADNTYNLGSSTKRWANIYSADLQLSNEGSQNDVDGTWGQYTIQEGEEDLFLINRRNGKKYKFVLQEVG